MSDPLTTSFIQRSLNSLYLAPVPGFHSDAPSKLLNQLKEAADIAKEERKPLTIRVLVSAFDLSDLARSISSLGFKKLYDRVEYTCSLDALKPDVTPQNISGESVISWISGLKSYGMDEIGAIYQKVSFGDPSGVIPGSSTPSDFRKDLEEDLADTAFHQSDENIQIGLIEDQPAAFVFAQVKKLPNYPVTLEGRQTIEGWSRLGYLGLLPEFRGHGYGRLVHQHGLLTLRTMGGLTYHGGTARNNIPMQRLFESSGCRVLRYLEEWKLM